MEVIFHFITSLSLQALILAHLLPVCQRKTLVTSAISDQLFDESEEETAQVEEAAALTEEEEETVSTDQISFV